MAYKLPNAFSTIFCTWFTLYFPTICPVIISGELISIVLTRSASKEDVISKSSKKYESLLFWYETLLIFKTPAKSSIEFPSALKSIVPLKIDINGELLRDGVEITRTEFWDKLLNSDTIPKTSQPSPQDFLNTYNALFEKGFKKIISIHASAKTSGTIQAAKVARSLTNRENDIELVDSQALSIMEGMLVVETAKKVVKNESFTDILNWLYQARSKAKFLIVITDLKYLEKGGRMNKASLMAGGLLHLKPIITMSQGEIIVEKKVIGEMGAIKYIEKYIKEERKKLALRRKSSQCVLARDLDLYENWSREKKLCVWIK